MRRSELARASSFSSFLGDRSEAFLVARVSLTRDTGVTGCDRAVTGPADGPVRMRRSHRKSSCNHYSTRVSASDVDPRRCSPCTKSRASETGLECLLRATPHPGRIVCDVARSSRTGGASRYGGIACLGSPARWQGAQAAERRRHQVADTLCHVGRHIVPRARRRRRELCLSLVPCARGLLVARVGVQHQGLHHQPTPGVGHLVPPSIGE
jgi:hypothetical protein